MPFFGVHTPAAALIGQFLIDLASLQPLRFLNDSYLIARVLSNRCICSRTGFCFLDSRQKQGFLRAVKNKTLWAIKTNHSLGYFFRAPRELCSILLS